MTERNELTKTIDGYDFAFKQSAIAVEDKAPEGILLAHLIQMDKSTPGNRHKNTITPDKDSFYDV